MTGGGRAHSQGPLEKAHTLTCRADEAYREGEFASAAKLYLEVDSRGLGHSSVILATCPRIPPSAQSVVAQILVFLSCARPTVRPFRSRTEGAGEPESSLAATRKGDELRERCGHEWHVILDRITGERAAGGGVHAALSSLTPPWSRVEGKS